MEYTKLVNELECELRYNLSLPKKTINKAIQLLKHKSNTISDPEEKSAVIRFTELLQVFRYNSRLCPLSSHEIRANLFHYFIYNASMKVIYNANNYERVLSDDEVKERVKRLLNSDTERVKALKELSYRETHYREELQEVERKKARPNTVDTTRVRMENKTYSTDFLYLLMEAEDAINRKLVQIEKEKKFINKYYNRISKVYDSMTDNEKEIIKNYNDPRYIERVRGIVGALTI